MERTIVTDKNFLHQKSKEVDLFSYSETKAAKHIIYDLKDTLSIAPNGIGLAAPQIGELSRIFIFLRYPSYKTQVVINPEILEMFGEPISRNEECLSCGEDSVEIPRFDRIKVKYFTLDNVSHTETLKGVEAIIFQHEFDHLNGVLISDYKPS